MTERKIADDRILHGGPAPDEGKDGPARRALAEAEARRKAAAAREVDKPKEVGGRDGPEPTRYGDWEKGGIASDF